MQMHEGESIHKHIDNFNRIVLSLRTIDVAVDDKDQLVLKRPITNLYDGGTSLGEGLMVRGRIEKREENCPKKVSKLRNKHKNNNKCHNCQRERH